MTFQTTGAARNRLFVCLLILVCILVAVSGSIMEKQDQQIKLDYERYLIGQQYLGQNEPSKAEENFSKIMPRYKDSAQLNFLYGVSLIDQNKYAESVNFLNRAKAIRPAFLADPNYLVCYGTVLFKLGKFSEARVFLAKASEMDSRSPSSKVAKKYLDLIDQKLKNSGRG